MPKLVKPNCSECLNKEGYGWTCEREGINEEYCNNFIPEGEEHHWRRCNYIDGVWWTRNK